MNATMKLDGERHDLKPCAKGFPSSLLDIPNPPKAIYAVGSLEALSGEGVAVIGSRKMTPYGKECAERFGAMLARHGITLVTGGARGCDAFALAACLDAGGRAVVVLGGGCDRLYPAENAALFQRTVDGGGAVVSEQEWRTEPLPFMFRARNRLIAGMSRAVLIIEAGLPSGTFSTADDAFAAGKEVLAVPGPITSPQSRGANRLIYQGAVPIVDDESLADQLFTLFGVTR